jgi:exopolysaccharide biosynthesis polyprenyl glycosylphosphotransferase
MAGGERPHRAREHRPKIAATARATAMSADLVVGLSGLLVGALVGSAMAAMSTAAWTATALLHTHRCRRFADVVDLEAYGWLLGRLTLAVIALTLLLTDDRQARLAAVGVLTASIIGATVRGGLGLARGRGRLGLDGPESVLLVGDTESVARTIAEWSGSATVRVEGVCLSGTGRLPLHVDEVPVVGRVGNLVDEAERLKVDVVALHDVESLGGYSLAAVHRALEERGVQTSLITPMTNTVVDRARIRRVGRRVTLDLAYRRPRGVVAATKGCVDRLVGAVVLVVALPVIAVCAVIVRATSPGPAFFKQTRVRENGREFAMYKLRTMTTDAEQRLDDIVHLNMVGGDGMFKMVRDPRVTRAGAWMRRLSLDELPQLWNVVRGDMSLIGPRPGTPDEVATYDDLAARRLAVKPGLTGLWQVSGRSNLSWEETVRIDQYYIDNWTPRSDLMIALRTVKALVTREGAY